MGYCASQGTKQLYGPSSTIGKTELADVIEVKVPVLVGQPGPVLTPLAEVENQVPCAARMANKPVPWVGMTETVAPVEDPNCPTST
jgi:hypothetical protein